MVKKPFRPKPPLARPLATQRGAAPAFLQGHCRPPALPPGRELARAMKSATGLISAGALSGRHGASGVLAQDAQRRLQQDVSA